MRVWSWSLHMALPLAGLWLLLARPQLDTVHQDNAVHFWLVTAVAAINVVLGLRMSQTARRRGDVRLFLVAMAFLSSAGFLGLHALATPRILLPGATVGFMLATPVGLALAGGFAALSAIEWRADDAAVARLQAALRIGLFAALLAWGTLSLSGLPPLSAPFDARASNGQIIGIAVVGCILYALAALRYFAIHRRRPAVVLLSVITAFVLLAEAMVAVALSRNWHVSWWEWHVLMLLAFGFVAYSARVQYLREGSAAGLFDGVALDETITRLRRDYTDALEALVEAVRRQADEGEAQPVDALAARVGERFELTERQTDVLSRSAEALAGEREQIERLGALVAVGRQATVAEDEQALLKRAVVLAAPTFPHDQLRVGLVSDGVLSYLDDRSTADSALAQTALKTLAPVEGSLTPDANGTALVLPLQVKGHAAGVLEARRYNGEGFVERERAVLESLASQLSIAVENARLYRQLDGLFRSYMSPAVATSLIADPDQAKLGGESAEITVLYADLAGFTPFAARTRPQEVVALLNRYYGMAVPILLEEGGTIAQFVGDEVVALFNAPVRRPDHAVCAARAGLRVQRAVEALVVEHPEWPRFRMGLNTGPAVIGNIGSAQFRNYTAIGDTMNLGARFQAAAEPGQILIAPQTYAHIHQAARVQSVGPLRLKGKTEPVDAFVLLDLAL